MAKENNLSNQEIPFRISTLSELPSLVGRIFPEV
jgi:hypothetical protein